MHNNNLSKSTKKTITELSKKKQNCPDSLRNITDKSYNEKLNEIEKNFSEKNTQEQTQKKRKWKMEKN